MNELWKVINRQIKACKHKPDPLQCLLNLFKRTNDGWVAFNIGLQYEMKNDLIEALNFFEKAQKLMPLPKYKEKARKKINEIRERLRSNFDVLYIVSCTKKKIWDMDPKAPDYVPAKDAYKGQLFIKWLDSKSSKIFPWIIFSSKYGLIEPDQPIKNYDVHINDEAAITDEMIKKQIKYEKFYGKKLSEFEEIRFVGTSTYFEKLRKIFEELGIRITKVQKLDIPKDNELM